MKKAIILNLPFKNTSYDSKEIKNFEKWIHFFAERNTEIVITPPVERRDTNFSENVLELPNPSL